MEDPLVAIIILNWNGWKDTIECLESVFQVNYPNYCVVLVDNHSTDESMQKIVDYANGNEPVKSKFFEYNPINKPLQFVKVKECSETIQNQNNQLFIIENNINEGFAEGNNIGMKFAAETLNPEYYLLLNNDTIVKNDFLKHLIDESEKDVKIGILGPKIYYYDHPNIIWSVGGKIDWNFARGLHIGINEVDHGQYDEISKFDYINGAALLLKDEIVNKVGLLNKNLFLYFEETDLALRAKSHGYRSLYVPRAEVWHKISQSGGGLSKPIGLYYITRNRWLFMKKWAKKSNYIIFVCYQLLGALLFPILLTLYYKNRLLFKAYIKGLYDGIVTDY
ncbi:MAG: glycosyltransferase family 2 protein [Methanobacterium sp. ERen5]|nr:MAG: glycosyltransferase family 2 protein [Methanobacterium sp. ERen5]